jgi:F-type H+-transporting ATPase subunit a
MSRFVSVFSTLISSSSSAESEKPGEVVLHHLTDHVIASGPFGWLNTHVLNQKLFGMFDMRITWWLLMIWTSVFLCLIIFIPLAFMITRSVNGSRSRWINMWEVVIEYIEKEVLEPNFEKQTSKFAPYFLTLFFFILFCNLTGLVPLMNTATGNLAVTGVLALLTFLQMLFFGFVKNGPFWIISGIVPPGLPWPIYILMWPIEIVGLFMKPLVLMIRLFANMLAGHIIVIVFIMLIIMFGNLLIALGAVPAVIFIDLLEIVVCFVQAYVFTMLTAIFVSSCMHSH